jgi:acetyl esterase/lipase
MQNQDPTIHPQLQEAAKMLPPLTFTKKNVWLLRMLIPLAPRPKLPADVRVGNTFIPAEEARHRIRLRVYQPERMTGITPALIWLHGGGYVVGKPEMDDSRCAGFVHELGLSVISVDYRLAPGHPFPAGLQDAYTALKWVAAHAQELGIDAARIAVGGGSAGGGLAAALAQLAHDRQKVRPVFQLLVYPMLDDHTPLRTDLGDGKRPAWNQQSNRFGWESYLDQNCGEDRVPEYAAPARRLDLAGLPPAWIGVGTVDLFHDEDAAYAQRLRACGVECELNIVPGAFHGFDVIDARIPLVQEFRTSQMAALKKYLLGK